MSGFKLWPRRHRRLTPQVDERKVRELEEAKGELQSAVADYRMKMDWARRLAGDTLGKLDEGRRR